MPRKNPLLPRLSIPFYPNTVHRCRTEGIGVALGSGGLKLFFHIGVLMALEEKQIPVRFIAGISAGAIIGALYANGMRARQLRKWCALLDKTILMRNLSWRIPHPSLLSHEPLKALLRQRLHRVSFQDLDIPLHVQVTELYHGTRAYLYEGSLLSAILASCAVPGLYPPVKHGNQLFVDGAVLDDLPLRIAKEHWNGILLASSLVTEPSVWSVKQNQLNTWMDHINQHLGAFWKQGEKVPGILDIVPRTLRVLYYRRSMDSLEQYPPDILVNISHKLDQECEKMPFTQHKFTMLVEEAYMQTRAQLESLGF